MAKRRYTDPLKEALKEPHERKQVRLALKAASRIEQRPVEAILEDAVGEPVLRGPDQDDNWRKGRMALLMAAGATRYLCGELHSYRSQILPLVHADSIVAKALTGADVLRNALATVQQADSQTSHSRRVNRPHDSGPLVMLDQ